MIRSILTHGAALLAGSALVAAVTIGFHDAIMQKNGMLIDELFEARKAMVETAIELSAIRRDGACDGIPIDTIDQVGDMVILRGDGFVAMRSAE